MSRSRSWADRATVVAPSRHHAFPAKVYDLNAARWGADHEDVAAGGRATRSIVTGARGSIRRTSRRTQRRGLHSALPPAGSANGLTQSTGEVVDPHQDAGDARRCRGRRSAPGTRVVDDLGRLPRGHPSADGPVVGADVVGLPPQDRVVDRVLDPRADLVLGGHPERPQRARSGSPGNRGTVVSRASHSLASPMRAEYSFILVLLNSSPARPCDERSCRDLGPS
jgi:hypothetical protein